MPALVLIDVVASCGKPFKLILFCVCVCVLLYLEVLLELMLQFYLNI